MELIGAARENRTPDPRITKNIPNHSDVRQRSLAARRSNLKYAGSVPRNFRKGACATSNIHLAATGFSASQNIANRNSRGNGAIRACTATSSRPCSAQPRHATQSARLHIVRRFTARQVSDAVDRQIRWDSVQATTKPDWDVQGRVLSRRFHKHQSIPAGS